MATLIQARRSAPGVPTPGLWIEPGTRLGYPEAFPAYRRMREAQERPLPRHRGLGHEVDRHISRAWRPEAPPSGAEVVLTFRDGAPPRVRRIVAEVLRNIRRGRSADEAIRRASRRFGLRQGQARGFMAACLGFATCQQDDPRPA